MPQQKVQKNHKKYKCTTYCVSAIDSADVCGRME